MASFEPQDFGLDDEPPPRPTTPPVRRAFVLILLVLCFMAGLVYGIPYVAERTGYAWESGRSRAAVETLAKLEKAGVISRSSELFRLATVAVSPAVVNIQTSVRQQNGDDPGIAAGGGGVNRFDRGALVLRGIGSGVIIDKGSGFIVTNNHVIQGADVITVRLSQGAEVPARLVGADPKTDLAVLQIKAPVTVAAAWGDSDDLAIGDWVLAIGSPYMLDHTVTAGIISATRRNNIPISVPGMDENTYQDFLQTDAAINPGNSGGPLVDLNGRIIGINTAILTSNSFGFGRGEGGQASGGFEGIGLAIPSTMARKIVEALIRDGKVVRGFLGVGLFPDPVPQEIVKQLKLESNKGALVRMVAAESPADKAGLRPADMITKLGDKDIPDSATLRLRAAEIAPGTEIAVEFYRGGAKQVVKLVVGEQGGAGTPALTPYGFRVSQLPVGPRGEPGLVIDQVALGTPAARAGLKPDFRILAVDRIEVHTLAEFEKAASGFPPERGLPLTIQTTDGRSAKVMVGGPVGEPAPPR